MVNLFVYLQAKTTLNNALIAELRRLNTKLDYVMERVVLTQYGVPTPGYRCTLELPYPERVTVVGEGGNKKDAERRCAAAACVKLMVNLSSSLSLSLIIVLFASILTVHL